MRQQEVNMKISTEVIIALLASFAISVVLSPIIIPFLKRLKIGQTERTEGVQSHLEKAGTPTMGGLIILISVLVTSLFFIRRYPNIIPVLFLTLGFGIIGFSESCASKIRRSASEAENARTDHCYDHFSGVYPDRGQKFPDDEDPVQRSVF